MNAGKDLAPQLESEGGLFTADGMRSQALGYIKDEIATIDALLSQSPGTTNELDALISELQGYMTSDTASP